MPMGREIHHIGTSEEELKVVEDGLKWRNNREGKKGIKTDLVTELVVETVDGGCGTLKYKEATRKRHGHRNSKSRIRS
jgi:hypothetical protein